MCETPLLTSSALVKSPGRVASTIHERDRAGVPSKTGTQQGRQYVTSLPGEPEQRMSRILRRLLPENEPHGPGPRLELDNHLAVDMTAGLKLDCRADVFYRVGRRNRDLELASSNQFGNVFKGTWGGLDSRNSSYSRYLSCDNGDTVIWNAELTRGFYRLRSV